MSETVNFKADQNGMVAVEAAIDGVMDNGKRYAAGTAFHMHKDLVPGHVAAGQVRLVADGKKQQSPASDKQVTGSANK